jgi:hypothetical protein
MCLYSAMGIDPVGGEKSIQLAVATAGLWPMNIPMSDMMTWAQLGRGNQSFFERAFYRVIYCGCCEN